MCSAPALPALEQRYAILGLIGHGPDASVYRAVDRRSQDVVALKLYDQRLQRDLHFVAHFRRTARQAKDLHHRNVLPTLDYGFADEHYYVSAEYISGGNFERCVVGGGNLSLAATAALLEACNGLQYLHEQGILHQNVTPANILLRDSGEAVIADAGPIHELASSGLTMTQTSMSSVTYLSPEQVVGNAVSAAADMYAFGIILYQTYTGMLPFRSRNPVALAMQQLNETPAPPSSINGEISANLEAVILRCLAKDPEGRFATMSDLCRALDAATAAATQSTVLLDASQVPGRQREWDVQSLLRRLRSLLRSFPSTGTRH